MSEHVNYYDILEVPHGSDISIVDKSYKKLLIKWHPDKNPKNRAEAEKKTKSINEAYTVLSDEKSKQIYDTHGYEGLQGGIGDTVGVNPGQMFEMLNQIGGIGGMLGQMIGGTSQGPDENCGVENIGEQIHISLSDAFNGKVIKKKIDRMDLCAKCDGSGTKDKTSDINCKSCNGNSPQTARFGMMCMQCKNSGIDNSVEKCKKCNGGKYSESTVELEVTIPRGVFTKCKVVLKEQGNQIPKGKPKQKERSDIIFVIVVDNEDEEHAFKRGPQLSEKGIDPANMQTDIKVSFSESISGFYKEIKHLDGHKVKFSVSEPCRHGDVFIVKNEGMPRVTKTLFITENGKKAESIDNPNQKFGDLVVCVEVEHPKSLEIDSEVKNKLVKLLDGKPLKVPAKTTLAQVFTLEQFKKDEQIQIQTEQMKKKYDKKNGKKQHKYEDEDCEDNDEENSENGSSDDGFAGFGRPGMGRQQVHVQECKQH
jgi:DnaJ-class molecular chaperone